MPTASISIPKAQLQAGASFSEFFGGDNEDLVKLAHASYVEEINKYNVIFGAPDTRIIR
jgi:hypothetical protein